MGTFNDELGQPIFFTKDIVFFFVTAFVVFLSSAEAWAPLLSDPAACAGGDGEGEESG